MIDRKNPIDQLFDEENSENIVLYNDQNEGVEFEQIAIAPWRGKVYAILRPVMEIPGVADDEAIVFLIDEENETLSIVDNEEVIDGVFEVYYEMLREEGIDVD